MDNFFHVTQLFKMGTVMISFDVKMHIILSVYRTFQYGTINVDVLVSQVPNDILETYTLFMY